MAETSPHVKPSATTAPGAAPGRRLPATAALVAGAFLFFLAALLGWFLGAAALTAVEPGGRFVNCGPALFHRPDPLPDQSCAGAYFPLPAVSVVLIVVGVVGAISCIGLLVHRATRYAQPSRT